MLKYLQAQSQTYFKGRTYPEAFASLSQRQRPSFYSMLLASHLSLGGEAVLGYLGESAANKTLDAASLLSAVWGLSLQVTGESEEGRRLAALVGALHSRNIVERTALLTDLPEWVVQGSGLAEGAASDRRVARVYTKINYEQSKYSLLRENNEGYAKMALLLANLRDSHDIERTWQRMLDLVGNFDLDPDRVLDLLVEARIRNYNTIGYLRLLDNFQRESIAAVLGNKMRLCKGKPIEAAVFEKLVYEGPLQGLDGEGEPAEQVVSGHLISLCAQLIKRGTLSYSHLLPYLEPADHFIRHVNSRKADLALQKVKDCFTLSMEEPDEAEKLKLIAEENIKFQGQLINSTKLALLAELVRLNAWTDFEESFTPFKEKLDLLLYQPLLRNLLDLVEWVIDPLFQSVGYHRFFRVEKPFRFESEASPKEYPRITSLDTAGLSALEKLMGYIGKYVGLRSRLFIKLCRLLKKEAKEGRSQRGRNIIQNQLILGSCVTENNAAMAIELFQLLDCYQYQFRYDCYLKVYRGGMSDCPLVARIFQSIKRRQNIIVNNLSKENKKLFIRKISKLTHNQALPVFYWIVRRIVMEDYEAVVPEIVAVICNCSPLTLDMAIFVMLYTLNQSKEPPVNAKTHECYPWFKNITTFISNFFRKYLQTDIQPVFDYIITKTSGTLSQLDDDELPGDLLKLLHQILNKMHGSVMISQVNKTKYDAIAAGPRLQAEILELTSQVRAAKKSKVFLQKFFWEKNAVHQDGYSLAFNLLVLLAQKRAELFTKCYIDDIKIVGQIFDEYSMLIVQIVRVLLYQAQDYNHYAQLLPADPLRVLLRDYKLPLEIACEVVRPGIKHIAVMSVEEWTQLTSDFKAAYAECLADERYLVKSSRLNEKWTALLSAYKEKVVEYIPISFFTAFWFLTLDSVYFPAKSYAEKIDDLKKKVQPNKRGDRNNEKELERMRTLLDKLTKEEQAQHKKYNDTLSPQNMKKLEVQVLLSMTSDKSREGLLLFAEQFVQTCLLPRMMLDRTEALYCVKFTIYMIKANPMALTKSIRLLTYIIEYVMGYLPFTTHREASNCISVFLAEILSIFNNWNDSAKLKQDLAKYLGVEEPAGKDNYPKLKDYLIKLFERVGNTLRGVKEEPYLIKNCLYILEKVDSIPSYKEQADELAQHMNELKQLFPTVDMRTSLDRQIAILTAKKNELPERPEKMDDKKPSQKPEQVKPTPPSLPIKDLSSVVKLNNPPSKSPITTNNSSYPTPSNGNKKEPEPKAVQPVKPKPQVRTEEKAPEKMVEEKPPEKPKSRFTEKPVEKKTEEPKRDDPIRRPEIRNPVTGAVYTAETAKFTEEKVEPKPVFVGPPKRFKEMKEELLRQTTLHIQQQQQNVTTQQSTNPPQIPPPSQTHNPPVPSPATLHQQPQVSQQTPSSQQVSSTAMANINPSITTPSNTITPPASLPVASNISVDTQSNLNSTKPRQQESKVTVGQPLISQKPASSATIEQITKQHSQSTKVLPAPTPTPTPQRDREDREKPQRKESNLSKPQPNTQKNSPNQQKIEKDKQRADRKEKASPTPEKKKEERWKDNNFKRDNRDKDYQVRDNRDNKEKQREPREARETRETRETRDNRQPRDPNKDRQQSKPKNQAYVFTREHKNEDRRQDSRKQEKRERSKERDNKDKDRQRQKDKSKEREKNKERERGYDKYHRSRSREKYGRR